MFDRRFLSVNIVIQSIANSPADNPTAGTQYIVGSSPTGAFAGASTNFIARFEGNAWQFTKPKAGTLEVLNLQTLEVLTFNGSAWTPVTSLRSNIAPVLAVIPTGKTLPASATAGDSFLNTDNAKLFTATEANSWDSGTVTANGSRYASSSDYRIYTSNGSTTTFDTLDKGDSFLNNEDNCLYVFNGSAFIKFGGASESLTSIVTEIHSLTADEVSAKSFSLHNNIAEGFEDNVLLFVSGVAQSVGVDFTASGKSISWNSKGLDEIGLVAGDNFIIHYVKE